MNEGVLVTAAPHPFRIERHVLWMPEGLTIEEMLHIAQPDPMLIQHAIAFIRGEVIPREWWPRVRPKAGVHIEFRVLPAGGGGGKNPLRTILMLAVFAAAFFIGPALGGVIFQNLPLIGGLPLGLPFGIASTLSGVLGSAIISIAGRLLVNAIAPIRTPKIETLSGATTRDSPTLFIEGARNVSRPFGPVPVVLGRHRMAPPFGAAPFTEIVGDKQFLRLLFVWGVGPLKLDIPTLRIGQTPLTDFVGVETEHREGRPGDAPLTLYSNQVNQQNLSILLQQSAGFVTRTSGPDADELSVDITFLRGLVEFDDRGKKVSRSVAIEIEFRKVGDVTFLTPIFTAKTVPNSFVSGKTVTFTQKKTSAIRHGFRWAVVERGQYEIRTRRTTSDTTSSQIFDEVTWSALRAITDEDPIVSAVPVAKTALRIQATDQLNRIVNEFTGIVTTIGLDWNGSTWVPDQQIQNPASLYRQVLQGNGIVEPLPDARLDLPTLQSWHVFNASRSFKFNMVRDFTSSVWDTLADVASAGRAAPSQIDGKWSVVIEQVQALPVSHITPRNSFDFRAEKSFIDPPDGWRIRFPNENEGYRQDERRVFRDGFDNTNAKKFEGLELPGVTDPDQIQRLGRFRIAQGLLQPERWTFQQDMEYLTYLRGDRVSITHDVLLVGLSSGRIKAVTVDGSNNVTDLTLDEPVTMVGGNNYGIAIRTIAGGEVTAQVVTNAGEQTLVVLTTPIPATGGQPTVVIGEIFGFGLLGQETDDASIIAIQPGTEFRASVVAVPYRPAMFDADTETIPTFKTNLTPLPVIPALTVRSVVSDESVLVRGPGESLRTRIVIEFDPFDDPRFDAPTVEITGRPTSTAEPFSRMETDLITSDKVIISGVNDGETLDLRLRFVVGGRLLPGPATIIFAHTVVGKSTNPSGLTGLTISVFGGQVFLRWDEPPELDVLFGGEVRFRHSADFTGATWSASSSIGTTVHARDLTAVLPLKPGTYLARVFDVSGNPSDAIASVTTKQANVLAFANVDSLNEHTAFTGIKTGVVADGGILKLTSIGLFDDIPDFDALSDLDSFGGITSTGTYDFAAGFDLVTVKRVRLTTRVGMTSINVLDFIDDRTNPMDDWEDFDGTLQAETDVVVFVRHTDDDPGGSPTFSAFERLDSAEFEARGFDFRAVLTTNDPAFNVFVDTLGVDVEEVV